MTEPSAASIGQDDGVALTDRPAASRESLRRLSFLFQDGMVLCATLRGLDATGLLKASLEREDTVAQLHPGLTKPAFGQLRVGLRTLAQAGWLREGPEQAAEHTTMRWTDAGRAVARHHGHFIALGDYLATFTDNEAGAWTQPWEGERATRLAELVDAAVARWELDDLDAELREQVAAQLDGALASPVLLWLDATGGLQPDGDGPDLPPGDGGEQAGRLLATLGWIDAAGAWTEAGRHGLDFVAHLGLVGSYLPMFARLPELYRGALTATYAPGDESAREWHIQDEMNLRASSVAHGRYFADADPIVASIFDREPLADQPRFVVLTGCDDGRWLVHMHELVRDTTLRGRHLDERPLRMVGIDRSEAAVTRAQEALAAAGMDDALVVRCDTGDPIAVRDALHAHGLPIEDGLHVHAFVDHERRYSGGHAPDGGAGMSSGAYIADDGAAIVGADVEADLSAHLARWAPHVARHGVLVLEAHCVSPPVTARHLGALHSLAFDAYSGYSGQYPVERPAFIAAARRAGLRQAATGERRYPTTRPFVAVSLNHMLGDRSGPMIARGDIDAPRRDTWTPKPGTDLRDGRGLHELVFDHGDLRHPRLWASASTSVLDHADDGHAGGARRDARARRRPARGRLRHRHGARRDRAAEGVSRARLRAAPEAARRRLRDPPHRHPVELVRPGPRARAGVLLDAVPLAHRRRRALPPAHRRDRRRADGRRHVEHGLSPHPAQGARARRRVAGRDHGLRRAAAVERAGPRASRSLRGPVSPPQPDGARALEEAAARRASSRPARCSATRSPPPGCAPSATAWSSSTTSARTSASSPSRTPARRSATRCAGTSSAT